MKKQISILSLALLALVVMDHGSQALAIDKREMNALKEMVPEEQLIQRCELETLAQLNADRVVAYTFAPMEYEFSKNHMEAPGAAYRKGGKWYRLSYSCTTSEDRMDVVNYSFKKGDVIPEDQWGEHNLFR